MFLLLRALLSFSSWLALFCSIATCVLLFGCSVLFFVSLLYTLFAGSVACACLLASVVACVVCILLLLRLFDFSVLR